MEEPQAQPEMDVSSEAIDAALADIVKDPEPVVEAPAEEAADGAAGEAEGTPSQGDDSVTETLKRIQLEGSVPEAVLEAARGLGDAAVLEEWAASLGKRGKKYAQTLEEAAALRKENMQLKGTSTADEATAQTEHATPTVKNADLEAARKALAASIGFGEEEQGVLASFEQAIVSSVLQQVAPFMDGVKDLQTMTANQMLESARGGLRETYPVASDAGKHKQAVNLALSMKEQGWHDHLSGQDRVDALMESAYKAMTDRPVQTQPLETEAAKAAKRSGSPMAPTPSKSRKMPSKDMTPDQLVEAKANYIVANPGCTADDVKRAFGEL